MISRAVYACEKCGFESDDLIAVRSCEKRDHTPDPNAQYTYLSKETIESFRKRIENIRAKDKKATMESGPGGIFYALYGLYVKGHYTTLNAALIEVERLYEFFESNKSSAQLLQ